MTIYKLQKDIKNPSYDGRKKYGFESLKVIPKGSIFSGFNHFSTFKVFAKDWWTMGDIAKVILDNSELCIPTVWHEIAFTESGNYHHCADEVIDQLLKDGMVTPDQVNVALNRFLSK